MYPWIYNCSSNIIKKIQVERKILELVLDPESWPANTLSVGLFNAFAGQWRWRLDA